jgi:hypothetical protein
MQEGIYTDKMDGCCGLWLFIPLASVLYYTHNNFSHVNHIKLIRAMSYIYLGGIAKWDPLRVQTYYITGQIEEALPTETSMNIHSSGYHWLSKR